MEKITRAVLTGATGMIGATLVQVLLKEGAEVWALVRRSSARIRNLPKNEKLHLVDAELNHLDDLMEYMEGLPSKADAFFHLGWEGTYGSSRQDLYLQNRNVKNTLDAVHLAHKLGCEVFVGAGSQAEYGKCRDRISPNTPTFPETGYGIGKLCAGQMSRNLCKQLGIRHVWTRILSVYGPMDQEYTMVMSGIYQLLRGERPVYTKGEQKWDYLYSEDAARALYLAGCKGRDQAIYCVGSGMVRPLREYILAIRDAVDPKASIGLGEVPYPEGQVMYLQADIETLTKDTGFAPEVSFEEGIQRTVQWCRKR